jgi:hypothetical protein
MDWNLKRRKFEQACASEIAHELTRALGPIAPETLAIKSDTVCRIFSDALDRNGVVDESAAERVLAFVPGILADVNLKFAELNSRLDAAMLRPPRRAALLNLREP